MEDRLATLDRSMEHFSQRIEVFVEEKGVLEGQVEDVSRLLEGKEIRRKVLEDDLKWMLHKVVVWVVGKVVESADFSLV